MSPNSIAPINATIERPPPTLGHRVIDSVRRMVALGAMFRRRRPPEDLAAFARLLESEGFDELWVVEDCFWSGGMSAAAVALAVTERITVGFGIQPAVARNAAMAAMDVAGLARMFPGRFVMGVGHGVADWMRQIGAFPASQLAALEETIDAVRRLLAGERLTVAGRHVQLDDVALVFPPAPGLVPPVLLGATGPKSLDVAARVADGLMLPEGSSADFVRAALDRAGGPDQCAVYVLFAVDDDGDAARAAVADGVAEFLPGDGDGRLALLGTHDAPTGDALTDGILTDDAFRARCDRYAVAGTPEECAASLRRLRDAGATSLVLVPQHDDDAQLQRASRDVVPLVRG